MSDYQNKAPAKSNALKDSKLKLLADPHEKAVQRNGRPLAPTLQVAIKDNQPRCIAYTNVEGDKQDGKIEAAMDAFTFEAVMEAIRTYARGELVDDKKFVGFSCIGHLWTQNGKSEKPMALAIIYVGRNADDVVFISVQSTDKSRPKITWKLYPTEWHGGVDQNGQTLSNKAISRLYATGYANLVSGIVNQLLVNDHISWEEIRDRKGKGNGGQNNGGSFNRNNGGGNRGGYGGNNGGGGNRQNNYSNNPAPEPSGGGYDEDLPF